MMPLYGVPTDLHTPPRERSLRPVPKNCAFRSFPDLFDRELYPPDAETSIAILLSRSTSDAYYLE
jgi:hypothetical protein